MLQHEWPPIAGYENADILGVLLVSFAFALIHSLFAANWTKNFIGTIMGRRAANGLYRFFYTLLSAATAAIAAHIIFRLPDRKLLAPGPLVTAIMIFIEIAGVVFGLWAFRQIDTLEFLGVRQAVSYFSRKEFETPGETSFISKGAYSVVRHPLYLAGIIIFTFIPACTVNRTVISVLADIYFLWGAWIEDKRMLDQFGQEYCNYMKSVPAVLPRLGGSE